jgi:heparan-alpha-glucosaminide N-acetyltransferase
VQQYHCDIEKPLLRHDKLQVEDANSAEHHWQEQQQQKQGNNNATQRLMSLDVFRGLTIAVMILVDDAGSTFGNAINHSPWNNITLADFVMPSFLFIVGLSMSLSFKKILGPAAPRKTNILKKATIRSIKLFLIGLFLQGGQGFLDFNLQTLRYCGILQRIAFAYFLVTLIELYVPRLSRRRSTKEQPLNLLQILHRDSLLWLAMGIILGFYAAIMFATNLPAPCHAGQLTEECNAAYYWDSRILGDAHLYGGPEYRRSAACSSCSPSECVIDSRPQWCDRPFDPEGIVSSFSAVGSCLIGLFIGHILIDQKKHHKTLCFQWFVVGTVLAGLGIGIHFAGMPMNKQLYSLSYMFFMAGFDTLLMVLCFFLIDMLTDSIFRNLFVLPFKWLGTNAMLVFFFGASAVLEGMIEWVYIGDKDNNLVKWWNDKVFVARFGEDTGVLLATLFKIAFWCVVCGILDKKKIFWKV